MTAPAALAAAGAGGLVTGFSLTSAIYRVPRCERPTASTRYYAVEVGTALLFVATTMRFGVTVELPPYLYLVTVGVALALIDFDLRRLPDSVILPSYVVSVVLLMPAGAASGGWQASVRALAGMVALLALYFALAIAYPNGLSFGDVKLAGLVGLYLAWLSWDALFVTAIGSLLIACTCGSAVVVARPATRGVAVPVGPCLVGAAVLALFVTAPISAWYLSLLPA